jgi:hypothetical protein
MISSVFLSPTFMSILSFFTLINFFSIWNSLVWAYHSWTDPGQEPNELKTGIIILVCWPRNQRHLRVSGKNG